MVNILDSLRTAVLAQGITNPVLPTEITSLSGVETVGRILRTLVSFLLVGGVLVGFLSVIIGAIEWIASSGDKNKLQEARDRVVHAIIALIILFSVFGIINLVGNLFGINLLQIKVPTVVEPSTPNPPCIPCGSTQCCDGATCIGVCPNCHCAR